MKEHPEHKAEARDDLRLLRSAKLGDHEAEKEKIRSIFMAILNDIKKDIDDGKTPGEPATSEFMRQIWDEAQAARQGQKPVTAEDMTAIMMGKVGRALTLDEKSTELFQQLAKGLLSGSGAPDDGMEGEA